MKTVERPKGSLLSYSNENERENLIRKLSLDHGYTINEACYLLKVTRRTIYRWVYVGTMSFIQRNSHNCISGDDIQRVYFS